MTSALPHLPPWQCYLEVLMVPSYHTAHWGHQVDYPFARVMENKLNFVLYTGCCVTHDKGSFPLGFMNWLVVACFTSITRLCGTKLVEHPYKEDNDDESRLWKLYVKGSLCSLYYAVRNLEDIMRVNTVLWVSDDHHALAVRKNEIELKLQQQCSVFNWWPIDGFLFRLWLMEKAMAMSRQREMISWRKSWRSWPRSWRPLRKVSELPPALDTPYQRPKTKMARRC